VNQAVGAVIGAALAPMQSWPPLASLAVLSLIAAVALLGIIKATVDPGATSRVKRRVRAGIFELRLFQDDPRTMVAAARELFRAQASYLRLMLTPLLWALVPLVLVIPHLDAYYGYRGLEPGQHALVKVHVSPVDRRSGVPSPPIALEAPDGVRVETPALWAPSLGEMAWRISAEREGVYELRITSGQMAFTKQLQASPLLVRRSPVRPARSIGAQLIHPTEPPLPRDAGIDAIEVSYPTGGFDIMGVEVHWLLVFVLLSTMFAFALRSVVGVVI
jgi:hypothetical protein